MLAVLATAGALLALPSATQAVGPPPHDAFAAAAPITQVPFAQTVDNRLAGIEVGEPAGCTSPAPAHTVWYRYQPATDGTLTLDTRGTDFRTTSIAVYTGAALDQLMLVKCRTTGSNTLVHDRLTVPVAAGTPYAVQVGSQSPATTGRLTLNAYVTGGIAGTVVDQDGQPAQVCISVIDADDRAYASMGSTKGAYRVNDLPPGSYRLRTRDCSTLVTLAGEVADVPVEVPSGVIRDVPPIVVQHLGAVVGRVTTLDGAPVKGVCVDVRPQGAAPRRTMTTGADGAYRFFLQPGTYAVNVNCYSDRRYSRQLHEVAVGGPGSKTVLDVVLEAYDPPANDAFAAAPPKTGDFDETVDLRHATVESGEPTACGYFSAWYRWTPGFTDTVALDATGPTAGVALFRGDAVNSLEQVACYDTGAFEPPDGPAALVAVEAGATYYVRVAADYSGGLARARATRLRGGGDVTIDQATTPCAAACPYWTRGGDIEQTDEEAACRPEPLAPAGAFQDHPFTVPADADGRAPDFLVVQLDPELDYDGFVCRAHPDEQGSHAVGSTADPIADCPQGPDLGCKEEGVFRIEPGDELVLRIYNWAADRPVTATYRYAG